MATLNKESIEGVLQQVKGMSEMVAQLEEKKKELESTTSKLVTSMGMKNQPIVGNRSDSIESRALSFFGANHPAKLVTLNTASERFKGAPAEFKSIVLNLKEAADNARFISQQFYGQPQDKIGSDKDIIANVKGMTEHRYGREELAPRLKAFGSTIVGSGDEWVPNLLSAQYVEEFELDKVIESKFREISMPSSPYDLPVQGGVTKARKIAESTQGTQANFTTSKLTFNATKIYEHFILPEELNEDSAPDIYGLARRELMEAQIRAVESAILNGDTDGTHLDSDSQAAGADVAEKFWKGLRREALLNSANGGTQGFGGAALTEANLRDMRAGMGKFGVNSKDLVWICGPSVLQQFLGLPSVTTVDKFGPMATVLQGALAAYQGIPIVVSQHMREDLTAAGVHTGTGGFAGLLLVNIRRAYVGMRRPVRMKIAEDLAYHDRWLMASYQRKDFVIHPQSAAEASIAYGINIAV